MTQKQLTRARDIADHMATLLAQISQANGFETDVGTQVFRGRRKIDDSQVPCLQLIEGEDKVVQQNDTTDIKVVQSYAVGGYARCDPDHPNDVAHQIISDVKKALFPRAPQGATVHERMGARKWGGIVDKIEYRGRDIGPRADGEAVVFAVVHIDVTYAEDLSNA